MNKFTEWLKNAWTDFLSWFGVEEQRIASLLYPIFKDAKQLVENDLWHDVIEGVPIVAAALTGATGGLPAALAIGLKAAEEFLLPLLEAQGVKLAQTTINSLSNALVAQAQAGLTAGTE
jgi:hypothetical protein